MFGTFKIFVMMGCRLPTFSQPASSATVVFHNDSNEAETQSVLHFLLIEVIALCL